MSAAQQLLDRVRSLAAIAELEADPGRYAQLLEVPAEPEPRGAAITAALQSIDELAARVMRIRLDHVLAHDTTIAEPTRRVFATTIVGYADKLDLLAERVSSVASRAGDPAPLVTAVVDAARATLALRMALRTHVLARVPPPAEPVAEEPKPEPTFADMIELD